MNYIKIKDTKIRIEDGDRGKNYPTPNELNKTGYCLFLNNKNIADSKLSLKEAVYITKEKHSILNAGNITFEDIILTTRGTLGNVIIVDKKFPLPARINSGMVILHKTKEFLQNYLYYFFQSQSFKNQIKALQSGVAQPQLPIKDLQSVSIPLNKIETQQHIVNTISFLLLKSL